MEIVGVIGDVRHSGLEQPPAAEMYIPYLQNPPVAPFVVVRTSGDPAAPVAGVGARAVSRFGSRRQDRALHRFEERFRATMVIRLWS